MKLTNMNIKANKPKVSIVCITYNHEAFISKALKGFTSQKTDFAFEAIIADDCSSDNSPAIIADYAKKFPNIIKPIFIMLTLYPGPRGNTWPFATETIIGLMNSSSRNRLNFWIITLIIQCVAIHFFRPTLINLCRIKSLRRGILFPKMQNRRVIWRLEIFFL